VTATAALERVGPYQLVKAIGAGGSARVDLARIERAYGFQRHVVIKRPLEHLRGDARAADSLRREARLGGRLRHPNLVAILDAGTYDGYDYIVLEYVHGGSLRDLMQAEEGGRVRDVSLDVALTIVRDVARGVHEAHELRDEHGAPLGLVHRDVSPGNVLVGLDGAVKLADFGIAKETRVATLSGSMHGTVTYMAPEQCRGHAFDRRADIFSLGVILYELVTGTRLFWADNDVASLHRVLAGTVPRPRKVKPSVASWLEDIIMTALAPDPDKRYADARTLADAIERYAAGAGHILTARAVAEWARASVAWRDGQLVAESPSAAAPPAAEDDLELFGDTSLVALIEATPLPTELPLATFGPTETSAHDEGLATQPQPRVRVPRRRAWIAALLGVVAAGAVIAIVAMRERPISDHSAPPRARAPSTIEMPVLQPEAELESGVVDDEESPAKSVATPGRPPKRKRKRPKPAPPAPSVPAEAAKSPPAKAGSAANVEWDPTLLLPSDKKKK
jgi:serine/threonine-protein kinase